ncbi:MAG: preprotein translocase subunit YajC [Oscillospiraceae bacterium]|nr:preprotein translocase subunit YajC [Oscillospiraceae bacterium]
MNLGLLTDTTTAGTGTGQTIILVGYIVIIIGALYFFMIRPQKKRQKAEEKLRNSVEMGDEIITIGGICGRVVALKEDSLVIESPIDHSKTKILKSAVQTNTTVHDDK